jgi:hypothetical protein
MEVAVVGTRRTRGSGDFFEGARGIIQVKKHIISLTSIISEDEERCALSISDIVLPLKHFTFIALHSSGVDHIISVPHHLKHSLFPTIAQRDPLLPVLSPVIANSFGFKLSSARVFSTTLANDFPVWEPLISRNSSTSSRSAKSSVIQWPIIANIGTLFGAVHISTVKEIVVQLYSSSTFSLCLRSQKSSYI